MPEVFCLGSKVSGRNLKYEKSNARGERFDLKRFENFQIKRYSPFISAFFR